MRNILILIDIQKEYTTEGRTFYLKGIESSLKQCSEMLQHARSNAWDIVHIQHSNQGKEGVTRFIPGTEYFNFVDGFEPNNDEHHFVKTDFSCYSSVDFSNYIDRLMAENEDKAVYVAGYNSVMCCLSTLEEARRRKHKLTFIQDASYALALPNTTEAVTHDLMLELYKAKGLANIISSRDILNIEESFVVSNLMMFKTYNSSVPSQTSPTINVPIVKNKHYPI